MARNDALRAHLKRILDWQDAHVSFDAAVENVAPKFRGVKPKGFPHTLWQLIEHIRLCQLDILEFCRNPDYAELGPDDYWPRKSAPPTKNAWDDSIAAYCDDRKALKKLVADSGLDLFAPIPHGTGQTYLREILLVADHNAYHVGQLVALRRLLGIWN
jgi:uncharacterized damage-inducible protein DinB